MLIRPINIPFYKQKPEKYATLLSSSSTRIYTTQEIIEKEKLESEKYKRPGIGVFFGEHLLSEYDRDLFYNGIPAIYRCRCYKNPESIDPIVEQYKSSREKDIRLVWKEKEHVESYVIEFKNMFGEIVESHITTQNHFIFNFDTADFSITGDTIAFALVYPEGKEAPVDFDEQIMISFYDFEDRQTIEKDYQRVFGRKPQRRLRSTDYILEALFFELRGLYPDAFRSYGLALDYAKKPLKPYYQNLYDDFCFRTAPKVLELLQYGEY